MPTHILTATNSPQAQVNLCLSSRGEQILRRCTLVLCHNIPTFQLKCMPTSSAHISRNSTTDSKHHIVQQTLENILSTQPQQLPVWLRITKLGVENGK